MPILKNLPVRLKGGGPTLDNALILRRMSLNISPRHHTPFDNDDDGIHGNGGHGNHWSPGSSLLDGDVPRDRNPFEDEEDENEANEGKKGNGGGGGGSVKASFRFKSPLKSLGKLGKNLRASARSKGGDTPSPQGSLQGTPSPGEKKKRGRRSSEGSLLRFAGKYRESLGSRKESLTNGELNCSESEGDSTSRRLSFMKMVGLGKLGKRESMADHQSQGPEDQPVQEEAVEEVKPREPLSVLEILQLVKKRDLFLADSHILELEQECNESAAADRVMQPEDATSPNHKDGGRRKAKDVELLYEELQKELWAVVRESLRSPTAGPNLGLVVQVLQQEEQADKDWALSEGAAPGGPRPRRLKQRWKEAVEEAADGSLPQRTEFTAGELDRYLDRLRARVVEDLGAANRNVVSIYPEEYQPFQVYVESYHQAVARRLKEITDKQLEITDIYSLLDWLHNMYNRDVLGTVCITTPFNRSQLSPLLPTETVDRLELDCLNSVRAKVTTELSQVLDEEEKRWMETLHIEEYQITLAKTVIQRLQVDLERSASINRSLGSRVAQCSLNGLADFLYSFQRKVEMFHEGMQSGMFGENEDGYVSKTIALVNCCPPFRGFMQRCAQCDPSVSEDSLRRANKCLDHIVQQGVRVLSERLYLHIRPFFERLVKRKWLSNAEPYEQIEALMKEDFKKYRRMDSPPYQLLVAEVHRRVVMEYLRSVMRGRIICTSMKMRKRMAGRLRDEGKQIKVLFKDLESPSSWLDSALSHISEIIQLEEVPSIQMEVSTLVQEFPDVRKKHVSAILNIRGMTRQSERQEILNIVKDIETSSDGGMALLSRDRALFAEVPVTSEVHCLNVGLSRITLTASSCFTMLRPRRRKTRTPVQENPDDGL
ncbi:tumor necrosis factor alpha-induced protein 2-like [Parambassis ranga]|uniref:Tumor necrosis factor alpha-induced protein 2-like n=1 Tax=Parambassis ranga TaxID=210632 RepID=A0A6P7JH29_9TELE|nr:tumor necrosis factor alpha-induced protein 2-like [Parambassis ranga]XP_028276036.1 tumor necrosis factor alpha-induced protein 2-like [Parambassis ranga]XP_028276037.1 tumor necrosis factor alpha-induced protein 2-like [Parambassis ranga]XP_028276038.1 tumor necrosis factor alpha-induced protein 2-like [Parambassis ranga]